jgi:predicted O-methyltransferase YrrM
VFDLLAENIETYCEAHTTEPDALFYQLWRETHLKMMNPRMASGKLQGMFLTFIAKMMRPQKVLEIGTFTGYSTLSLAAGMPATGHIDTIESDAELEDFILKYFQQFPYTQNITLHIGNALDIIPQLPTSNYDLAFIDADKEEYDAYYELLLPKMRKGGIMLADNVLWSTKVIEKVARNDKDTKALIAFNEKVQADPRVCNMLLPFRDGIMLIEKL